VACIGPPDDHVSPGGALVTSDDERPTIEALATAAGFKTVRFAAVGPTPHADAYRAWIAAGHHGEMAWLARAVEGRADPRHWLPTARSAVVLAVEHHHERPSDPGGRTGLVARYAWGRDYHNLVGKRLKKLKKSLTRAGIDSWGSVDTAPIIERAWAEAAGVGFVGKNTVMIRPARTSWLVLAVLFVDVPCRPDAPLRDHCGRCTRCLDGCPTHAFVGPRTLDATRCIAYWTIEARGLAPEALLPGFGRWVFGCDVCQEVCPHNAAPPDPDEDDLRPRHAFLDLDEVLATPDDALLARFIGTPLARAGGVGLKRNALVALGNLGDPGGTPAIESALGHADPAVAAAARWAAKRLE
jgi:epoxyqueuosine reductase